MTTINTYYIRYTYGKRFDRISENGEKLYSICEGSGWFDAASAHEAMQKVRQECNDKNVVFTLVMHRV